MPRGSPSRLSVELGLSSGVTPSGLAPAGRFVAAVLPLLVALSLVAAACSTTIDTSTLDKSCDVDDDCVVVASGDMCDGCECPSDAIASSAQGDYGVALESISCPPSFGPVVQCDCAAFVARCIEGACVAEADDGAG